MLGRVPQQARDGEREFEAGTIRHVIELIASKICIFHSSPTECFFAVGKCPHLGRLAITDGINIRRPHLVPFLTALGSSPYVNEHDDAVSRSDKPFWLAVSFGPGGT